MNEYMFIFGRDSNLSLLEVFSYFRSRNIEYKSKMLRKDVVVFLLPKLDFNLIINDLGGTVKIGKIINNLDETELFDKIKFGISVYRGTDKSLREELKNKFKEEGIKYVYKPSSRKENVLSPTESNKVDLEFLVYDNVIAKLIAVYNPFEYGKRDVKRPAQNPIHQISLRLAKIMINISGVKEGGILLDPFCGIGTILQEALLMNINVIGVDNDKDMIKAAERNLKWLKKKNWLLFNEDSSKIKLDKKVEVIVTEPYLGPFLKKKILMEEEANNIIKKLENLYFDVLFNIVRYLKDDGRVVIIVPGFKTNKGKKTLDFNEIMNRIGLRTYNGIKEIKIPILYSPPESRIDRFIYILERK